MRANQRLIEHNPAGYALHEIDNTLNSIEDQVSNIDSCTNIKCKVTGVDPRAYA